ncbi:MAG: ABC transporter permease [Microbacteriaceae bacterium]|nr:ABC transporter permease [Microbacteriaceae bacterium]
MTLERQFDAAAPIQWKMPIILSVAALVILGFFGFGVDSNDVVFRWSNDTDAIVLANTAINAQLLGIVLGAISVLAAAASIWFAARRKQVPWYLSLIVGFSFIVGLISSVGVGTNVNVVFILSSTVALSTVIVFGSLAGIIGERVGVVNIAIEGQLLMGAFVAAFLGTITGSLWVALIAATLGGALVSMVLAVFSIKYLVDQIIVGVVLNVLVSGITAFFFSTVMSKNGVGTNFPGTFPIISIPFLSDIPVIGPVLFSQRLTTYLMFILVPLVWFVLFKTKLGLRLRSMGEHPLAADTVGLNVNRTRFWAVTLAGLIAGLGGAALTVGSVGSFVKEMSAGQGFIALAVVILGRWHPIYAAAAALLFGFAGTFRIWAVQAGAEIPSDLIQTTPYLVTLLAVTILVGKSVAPASVGKAYEKQ